MGGMRKLEEKENYMICTETAALKEIYHMEYRTIIYDLRGIYYSKKSPIQLLDEACMLKGGADYRGKLRAMRIILDYPKKTPLIISHQEFIYAFPTKSPDQFDCRWVFPRHIKDFIYENGKYYVVFKNGLKFEINCSPRTFKKQLERASHCMLYYLNLHPFYNQLKPY